MDTPRARKFKREITTVEEIRLVDRHRVQNPTQNNDYSEDINIDPTYQEEQEIPRLENADEEDPLLSDLKADPLLYLYDFIANSSAVDDREGTLPLHITKYYKNLSFRFVLYFCLNFLKTHESLYTC